MEIVDIQQFLPWGLIYTFALVVFSYNIIHAFLDEKYRFCPTLILIAISRLIIHFITMKTVLVSPISLYLLYGLWFLMIFIITLFTTKGSVSKKVIATVTCAATFMITVLLGSFGCLLLAGDGKYIGLTNYYKTALFFIITFCCAMSFLYSAIIKLIRAKKDISLNYNSKYAIMLLFPFSHLIFTVAFVTDFKAFDFTDYTYNIIMSLIVIAIFALDFFVIFFMDKMKKIEEQNMENEKVILKNEMNYQQVKMLSEEKNEFRKLKHDMANILVTSKGFIEIGKPDKALDIINKATDDLSAVRKFSLCSDDTINTVISIKSEQAENEGISLHTNINEEYPVRIDSYDICRLLTNIIDNAVHGAETAEDKNVTIDITITEDNFSIISQNKYTEDKKKKKTADHGHGIGIIKDIAKKYSGKYEYTSEDNTYKTETSMKNIQIKAD